MLAILIDGILAVLLVVLVAAGAWQLFSRTGPGIRFQQTRNRRRIEQGGGYSCSVHGPSPERDLVRLPSGETLCPRCYEEIHHAHLH